MRKLRFYLVAMLGVLVLFACGRNSSTDANKTTKADVESGKAVPEQFFKRLVYEEETPLAGVTGIGSAKFLRNREEPPLVLVTPTDEGKKDEKAKAKAKVKDPFPTLGRVDLFLKDQTNEYVLKFTQWKQTGINRGERVIARLYGHWRTDDKNRLVLEPNGLAAGTMEEVKGNPEVKIKFNRELSIPAGEVLDKRGHEGVPDEKAEKGKVAFQTHGLKGMEVQLAYDSHPAPKPGFDEMLKKKNVAVMENGKPFED